MAERPEQDTGPRVRTTIYPPSGHLRQLKVDGAHHGVDVTAIVTELIDSYLALNDEERAAVATRSSRWMRPKGGAARADGDSD